MNTSTPPPGPSDAPTIQAPKKKRRTGLIVALVVVVLLVATLGGAYAAGYLFPRATNITGAGSSFVYPLMSDWSVQYNQHTCSSIFTLSKASCVQINYQSIGSGGGIAQLTAKTVDFGASDAPLSPAQRAALPGPALTIPDTVGAISIMYNVQGIGKGLNLTGAIIAEIFYGNITNWNDPAIAAINAGVTLPSQAISVVHRSDSSGTSFAFTTYLSASSPWWALKVGKGTSVNWPVGLGAKGSSAVASTVASTAGGIGYAEVNYAILGNVAYAKIQNAGGVFVLPDQNSVAAAAASVAASLPAPTADWGNVSLLNQPGAGTYPLATFSYIMVYADLGHVYGSSLSQDQATALVKFLWWMAHDGQARGPALYYVPLPSTVVTLDESAITSIQFNGGGLTSH